MDVLLASGSGYPVWSVVELPGAPAQPYLRPDPGTAKGTVSRQTMRSEALKQERTFAVYVPPGYDDKGEPCTLVVLFDGDTYHSAAMIPGPTIMDNLIAARRIPRTVAVFVDSVNRAKELDCSEAFAAFVAKELVPWVRGRYNVSPEAGRTIVGGLSLGGVMASYCALKHSDVFGNVLSQSGSYWVYPGCFDGGPRPVCSGGGSLAGEFVRAGRVPVRFYLEAGRFENDGPDDLLGENRRFRDVLLAKGYDVSYAEFSGGHHYVSWRGSFAEALVALTSPVGRR
jgi:enterochelin esterase family protein